MVFPPHFQAVLWSKDIKNINLQADRTYVIHQVLMYGTLADWKFLQTLYPMTEIEDVFLQRPVKVYNKPAFNFVKKILLNLGETKVDESAYLTSLPRAARP